MLKPGPFQAPGSTLHAQTSFILKRINLLEFRRNLIFLGFL